MKTETEFFIIAAIIAVLAIITFAAITASVNKSTRERDSEELRDFMLFIEKEFDRIIDVYGVTEVLGWQIRTVVFVPQYLELYTRHEAAIEAKIDSMIAGVEQAEKHIENMLLKETPCTSK